VSIFKDCDIRGVYGEELDDDTGLRLGKALGRHLAGRTVVVGGDLRPSTPALKGALIEGLAWSGCRVIDVGSVPTPTLYYAKRALDAHSAVMVTASHNPARYNGFKLMIGDRPITPEALGDLARVMAEGVFVPGPGTVREERVAPAYADALVRSYPGLSRRRVVVDAGNGSMWDLAPDVLKRAGQQVEPLFCEPDGSFPHRNPNPAVPAHLSALRQRVCELGADLGIAYDGDGDRVVFVDERGEVQPPDRVLVLFVRHALAEHPGGAVVYDLKASSVVAEETLSAGGQPLMERSGHAFIKARLLDEGAVLGGEVSGHYFFGEIGGDDALYATLYYLRVLDAMGLSSSRALATVPAYPITPDIRVPCPPEEADAILVELERGLSDRPIDRLDGVRVRFEHGWALARRSVTEPLITLRIEAHTSEELEHIRARVLAASPRLARLLASAPNHTT
jgi:phosphomannomutase / phosphoglucomutase